MTLVSSVWREVTQKLGLLKALIGFCTIAGEESKRKAEPRTRSASRLSLAEMKRFELLRRGTPDLPHFELYRVRVSFCSFRPRRKAAETLDFSRRSPEKAQYSGQVRMRREMRQNPHFWKELQSKRNLFRRGNTRTVVLANRILKGVLP